MAVVTIEELRKALESVPGDLPVMVWDSIDCAAVPLKEMYYHEYDDPRVFVFVPEKT